LNDGLFQIQLGGELPEIGLSSKVLGGWVLSDSHISGRVIQSDGQRQGLPTDAGLLDLAVWTHLAFRGDGGRYEVFVNGESSGTFVAYDGTLADHDTLFIGRQATSGFTGRIDDFRVYSRPLSEADLGEVMSLGVPEPTALGLLTVGLSLLAWYGRPQGSSCRQR
jgi:hypothetical protein